MHLHSLTGQTLQIGNDKDVNVPVSMPAVSGRRGVRLVCSSRSTFAYFPVGGEGEAGRRVMS